ATVSSWFFIVLLRFLAGIMVWIMIALVIVVIAYGKSPFYNPSRTASLLFVLSLMMNFMIYLKKNLFRALGHVTSSLFYPLLTSFLLAVVIAYWAVTAVYLATSNAEVYHVLANETCPHRFHKCDPKVMNQSPPHHVFCVSSVKHFYNVFLFFWCCNFVTALGQVTLAGAFASYYWAFKKPDDMPPNPVLSSLARTLKYHTGSVAFGSLILSVIQIIRVLLEYLDQKLQGARNKYTQFLLKCMKCFFWCLETCIKFLNRNAYIMIAIYGKSFCTSAQDAFMLLLRNIVRLEIIICFCSHWKQNASFPNIMLTDSPQYSPPNLNYYWVPIMTNIIGSYFIAHGFFSVYSMCVDTLFLCFCEDLERNDGTPGRPYYMSPELRDLIGLGKRSEGDGDDSRCKKKKKKKNSNILEKVLHVQLQIVTG
uniref:Choline transporter-like protein n=1 Tax=Hippocampus comes TaxID=109280 RepID=A0A3Q3E5V3_HIPCM